MENNRPPNHQVLVPDAHLKLSKTIAPPKPILLDHLVLDVHIKHKDREHVYSNILVALVCTMNEDKYLKLTKSSPIMEEIFLHNKAFTAYLICYRPNEYKQVKAYLQALQSNGKGTTDPYMVLNAHTRLFPDSY